MKLKQIQKLVHKKGNKKERPTLMAISLAGRNYKDKKGVNQRNYDTFCKEVRRAARATKQQKALEAECEKTRLHVSNVGKESAQTVVNHFTGNGEVRDLTTPEEIATDAGAILKDLNMHIHAQMPP